MILYLILYPTIGELPMSPFAHLKVIELEVTRCTRITGGRGDTENNYLHSRGSQFKGYIVLIVTK